MCRWKGVGSTPSAMGSRPAMVTQRHGTNGWMNRLAAAPRSDLRRTMTRRGIAGTLIALSASTAAAQNAPTLVVTAGATQLTLSWVWSGSCDPSGQNPGLACEFSVERSPGGDVCLFTALESLPDSERNYADRTAAVGEKTCY